MNPNGTHNDGPRRFARNWLKFDDSRPTRPNLLRNFIAVIAVAFAAAALLAIINAFTR